MDTTLLQQPQGTSAPYLSEGAGKEFRGFANIPAPQRNNLVPPTSHVSKREKAVTRRKNMCVCVYTYSRTHIHIHTCTQRSWRRQYLVGLLLFCCYQLNFFIARKARPRPLISTLRALMILVQFSLLCGLDTLHCNSNHPKHPSKHEVITFLPKCKWLSTGDSFWELGPGRALPWQFLFPQMIVTGGKCSED